MKRTIVIFLALTVLISGCGSSEKADTTGEVNVGSIENTIDDILKEADNSISDEEREDVDKITNELKSADEEKKMELAIDYSTDVAIGKLAGFSDSALLIIGGKALEAYPDHPLVINNFAALLPALGRTDEAISLFKEALKSEPENPVIHINLANAYIYNDNFQMAENHAKQALIAVPDFGAAYQVLTTVHLKNGNSELAAETMVKSAKHIFNDLTIHHFESFLEEAANLDVEEDYPLNEEFLDELYDIAKEDVMLSEIFGDVDTPEAQIKIKPFPEFGDIDNLIASGEYIGGQLNGLSKNLEEALNRSQEYYGMTDKYMRTTDEPPGYDGNYPVKSLLRQIYAFKVMTSFYEHKLNQIEYEYMGKINKCLDDLEAQKNKEEELCDQKQRTNDLLMEALEDQRDKTSDPGKIRSFSNEISKLITKNITIVSIYLNKAAQIDRMYYEEFMVLNRDYYDTVTQMLREYWVRSGGLLKYIYDEGAFYELDNEREVIVHDRVYRAFSPMIGAPMIFGLSKQMAEGFDDATGNEINYTEAASAGGWGDLEPEIEKRKLPKFKEIADMPTLGLEGKYFSVTYNGEKMKVGFGTNWSSHSFELNAFTGEMETVSLYGVTAGIDKTTQNAFGKLKMGFKMSGNVMVGEYVTRNIDGKITDQGKVQSIGQSTSLDVGGIDGGFSSGVEIRKSLMTGLTEVNKSKKYKFLIGSISDL